MLLSINECLSAEDCRATDAELEEGIAGNGDLHPKIREKIQRRVVGPTQLPYHYFFLMLNGLRKTLSPLLESNRPLEGQCNMITWR